MEDDILINVFHCYITEGKGANTYKINFKGTKQFFDNKEHLSEICSMFDEMVSNHFTSLEAMEKALKLEANYEDAEE